MITELAIIASTTFVSMMSPGPDMILIIKNCAGTRLSPALYCIAGICCGLCIHVSLAILGIAALIAASEIVFSIIKLAGAIYLIYLGGRSILTKAQRPSNDDQSNAAHRSCFLNGFFCNLLNPKVTIFILAMFTQVIAPESSIIQKMSVGILLICEALIVWSIFAIIIRRFLPIAQSQRFALILNRSSGLLLILFGIMLAFAQM